MPSQYNSQAVRELLNAAFSASDISTLAFDRFHDVYEDFTPGMTKGQMIQLLLDWVLRQQQVAVLLSEIEQRNPHQYARYAAQLPASEPPPPLTGYQQRRLQDLQQHIAQDSDLLRRYEIQLRLEDDPRRLQRIEHEIERQKEALTNYQQQYDALQAEVGANQLLVEAQVQTNIASLSQKIEALSQQIEAVKNQIIHSVETMGGQLSAGQQAILQQMEKQHQQTVAVLVQKLDEQQVEVVELLLDAHDQQKIAQWQGEQLLLLSQQAVLDLRRLRQDMPEAAQWQTVLELLQREAGWQQKLKLTLPLIPGILEFESEAAVDVMPALKQSWHRLVQRLRGD